MNEYLLLNIAVAGILAGATLIVIALVILGRAVTLVWHATRRLVEADAEHAAGRRAYWESVHAYWAALDAVRKAGVRS